MVPWVVIDNGYTLKWGKDDGSTAAAENAVLVKKSKTGVARYAHKEIEQGMRKVGLIRSQLLRPLTKGFLSNAALEATIWETFLKSADKGRKFLVTTQPETASGVLEAIVALSMEYFKAKEVRVVIPQLLTLVLFDAEPAAFEEHTPEAGIPEQLQALSCLSGERASAGDSRKPADDDNPPAGEDPCDEPPAKKRCVPAPGAPLGQEGAETQTLPAPEEGATAGLGPRSSKWRWMRQETGEASAGWLPAAGKLAEGGRLLSALVEAVLADAAPEAREAAFVKLPGKTGVVVDVGATGSRVIAFINGAPVLESYKRVDVGGQTVSAHLQLALTRRNPSVDGESQVVADVKRLCCGVVPRKGLLAKVLACPGVPQVYCLPDPNAPHGTMGFLARKKEAEKLLKQHKMAGAKPSSHFGFVTVMADAHVAPELLFTPSLGNTKKLNAQGGISEAVYECIMACPSESRAALWSAIILEGSTTLIPGLKSRLYNDLRSMAPHYLPVRLFYPKASALGLTALKGGEVLCENKEVEQGYSLPAPITQQVWAGTKKSSAELERVLDDMWCLFP
ncbi:Actin-related protein 6 [Diplonema papillatum]|nr:Actin-related protein 6 [Diplonema papillatum]